MATPRPQQKPAFPARNRRRGRPHSANDGARNGRAVETSLGWLSGGLDRATLVVAGVATLGLIMATLDTTIVNVALDTLSRHLHASLNTIQWVSTGYLLSLAAVIPLSGWLTERFGSRQTWIVSIALFAFGSGLCALATSAGELIAFRVLQGLGGGMLMPIAFTLIAQSASPERVGRAIAVVGVPVLLGPVFGPIIGGLIVDNAPWQWIFVVNLPIAIVAIALAVLKLKPTSGRADAGAFDWLGAALLSPGLAGIVFGLSETESQGGIGHPIALVPIIVGLGLIGLFSWRSLKVQRPLIDLRLFRCTQFRAAALVTFFLGALLFGTLLVLPLYYQIDRGASAVQAGLLLAPQGIGAALMLPVSGRLTDRIGGGAIVLPGILLITAATVPLVFVTAHTPYVLLSVVLFIRGLGLGATVQPAAAAAYRRLSSAEVPRATAALNALRQVGGSIGTALLAVVLQGQSKGALAGTGSAAAGLLNPVSASVRTHISGPLATAFGNTFMWSVVLGAIALLPATALLLTERPPRCQRRAQRAQREAPDRAPLSRRGMPRGRVSLSRGEHPRSAQEERR